MKWSTHNSKGFLWTKFQDHLKVIEIFSGADQNLMSLITLGLKPFILVSGQEHHSNLLPWKEAGCEIVTIGSLSTGTVYTLGQ